MPTVLVLFSSVGVIVKLWVSCPLYETWTVLQVSLHKVHLLCEYACTLLLYLCACASVYIYVLEMQQYIDILSIE